MNQSKNIYLGTQHCLHNQLTDRTLGAGEKNFEWRLLAY